MNGKYRLLAAVLLMMGSPLSAWGEDAEIVIRPTSGSRIQEFVISVSDLTRTLPAFTEVLQWQVLQRGRADMTVARIWGLPVETEIEQVLVGNAASDRGFVRLVEIKGLDKQLIRPGARWWDTGGLMNLNVLVKDLDATVAGLRARGWHGISLPSSYRRGESVRGKSMIMIGPDDVMLSFQQRQAPPLQGWPPFDGASHIEVGYQIVSDIDAWRSFYTDTLGFFATEIRERRSADPVGPNDYGLPHNLVGVSDNKQVNVMLPAGGKQSLGAREHLNARGYDFSPRANPPNLGIMTVRLPVANVLELAKRLVQQGVALAGETQIVRMAPYGAVRSLAVRSPGGSGLWLELFEPGARPASREELAAFFKDGRVANWTRFNNRLTGTVEHRADGSAHVSWKTGLNEEGIWRLKGNAVCTAWYRLRDFREQCDVYYKIGDTAYQSFTVTGRPDGLLYWK